MSEFADNELRVDLMNQVAYFSTPSFGFEYVVTILAR